jgi:hypothetical protein
MDARRAIGHDRLAGRVVARPVTEASSTPPRGPGPARPAG